MILNQKFLNDVPKLIFIAVFLNRYHRCAEKLKHSNQELKQLKKRKDLDIAKDLLKDQLTPDAFNIVMAQLATKNRRRRWSKEVKVYCLALAYKSPAAYRYLRSTFRIPSLRTLQRLFENFDLKCGFQKQLIELMKHECEKMQPKDKYCIVCFDEMALTARMSYDKQNDCVNGFANYGSYGQTKELGNHALVFMASGIFSSWKQPLGFFISRNSAASDVLKTLLFECIKELSTAGYIVKAVICDMGSTNQKLMKDEDILVSEEKPYFFFQNEKIFVFFDPPHLLKCMRNNLSAHDFAMKKTKNDQDTETDVESENVSWRYITQLYGIESGKPVSLRAAPKLTKKHVELGAFMKMKVKRASQVFSQSVYAALMSYVCSKELPTAAIPTASFVKQMDILFDIFNSSSKYDKKIFRKALYDGSPSLDFLREALKWLDTIEVLGVKSQPPSIKGWKQSINALLGMWHELGQVEGISYLCVRKVSQDCLENCFSRIRGKGGFCMFPDVEKFRQAYKFILLKSCLSNSKLSNCENDSNSMLIDIFNVPVSPSFVENCEPVSPVTLNHPLPELYMGTGQSSVVLYVAGYVAHKLLKNHYCVTCKSILLGDSSQYLRPTTTLISNKAYNFIESDHGSLCMPSPALFRFIQHAESMFQANFALFLHMPNICSRLRCIIHKTTNSSWFTSQCGTSAEKLVEIYVHMRVMYAIKFINQALSELPKGKRNLRAVILEKI